MLSLQSPALFPFLLQITKEAVFSASGCWSDVDNLASILKKEVAKCEWETDTFLDCSMLAYFLAHKLYKRRGFPFFSFCILGGFDKQGKIGEVDLFCFVAHF
ncbi:hypothetical protein EON65_09555 [archaeon]|nr:MAG: hypothetical protein EON65_09555 [archaeon]